MKIALVSAYTHPFAVGLRYVSSYLKAAGHDVRIYFMSSKVDTVQPDYSEELMDDFIDRMRDVDLIGVSLMTSNFHRAQFLTESIREAGLRTPIVWGGTHPTVAPEESLQIADVVCVGEGEEALLQLAERMDVGDDPTTVESLWFRGGGLFGNHRDVRNPLGPLQTDLDALPFPDYELETQWVADGDTLVRATPKKLRGALDTLRMITSRGCPYHCTFCNNAALRNIHKGLGKWVRTRSVDNVLAEITHALRSYPGVRSVNFVDDLFFVRSEAEIEDFVAKYNAQVKLPLQMDAFPNMVSERKVRAIAKVPIELVSMGVESASTDTLENLYKRPTPKKRIAEAIDAFKRAGVRAEYHYIITNPYEPEENVVETMRFVADHHKGPSVLRIFPLMFYPGTPLYERAKADGLIGDRDDCAYDFMGTGAVQCAKHDYLGLWLRLVLNLRDIGAPRWLCHQLISFATTRAARFVLDRRWFGPTVFVGYQVSRKIVRNFLYQPFVKPFRYLKRDRSQRHVVATPWKLPAVDVAAMRRRATAPQSVAAESVVAPAEATTQRAGERANS